MNTTSHFRCIAAAEVVALVLLAMPALVSAETVAILADRIITADADQPQVNGAILVRGDRIVSVGSRDSVPVDARVINLGDATLMPGMIDAHAHPLSSTGDYQNLHLAQSSAYKSLRAAAFLQKQLLAGWTGQRVAGDNDVYYGDVDIKRTIDEGAIIGPHMAVAGHYISITGGGGDVNYLSPEQQVIADGLVVDGVDAIRLAVRKEIKYGSDWIKVLATGAYLSVGDSPKNVSFSPEEFTALMQEADRQGVPVMAHAHATAGIKQAVRAGVRSIEHGTFLDDEAIDLLVKHGTWLIPTIYIGDYYVDEGTLRESDRNSYYIEHEKPVWMSWLSKAHKKGVKIGVGVDFGGQGYEPNVFAREFRSLTEFGMSNMEAIQAGTRVNAELMQWDDLGTLAAGKIADIIAVPGDPLKDISLLESVHFVMLGGRIIKAPGIPPVTEGMLLQ